MDAMKPSDGEKTMDAMKPSDGNSQFLNDQASRKKNGEEKSSADPGNYFDCRICLDVAKDPVVTCCGHLFCWPCLYKWLNVNSVAKECPVCKGAVTTKNVTPINGRGEKSKMPETKSGSKIPSRPKARRVESWRQAFQKAAFVVPMEEMVRRIGHKFDSSQVQPHTTDERTNSLLNRIMTSRGMRREQNNIISPNAVVDLAPSNPYTTEMGGSRENSTLLPGSTPNQAATISNFTSAFSSVERFIGSDFPNNPVDRNAQMPLPVDDGDDFFSVAAEIFSEGDSRNSILELDAEFMVSATSSRRRVSTSTTSDVGNGYSRSSRRKRRRMG